MAACALSAGVLFTRAADRTPVLVVERPVRAGQVVKAEDLREVLIGSNPTDATITASRRDYVVGKTAAVDLVPGALLSINQVWTGSTSGTGLAVIGAILNDGQYPIELAVGDKVTAVVLPDDAAGAPANDTPASTLEAVVEALRPLDDGGGVAVSLGVTPARAPSLAVAGARGRLTLVLAPR